MSYEFNPESAVFEFPNPYKVENLSLIVSATFMILGGIFTMLTVRERLGHGLDRHAVLVAAIAILLLLFGIGLLGWAFSQLRYFFGRNRPASLAPLLANDSDGSSATATQLKETLRQNAVTWREPSGALNGLLYSWLPHLIFAPQKIQDAAQKQFHTFLSLSATLLSFLICWFLFGRGEASGWIGLIYAAFAAPQILPKLRHPARNTNEAAQSGAKNLIVLVVMALLGPAILALLASHLPSLGQLSINGALALALVCALIGCWAFGIALKNQLQPSPQAVGSARVMETLTMNAHPNKLIEELDRILMTRWYSRIPNRRYARQSPNVVGQQGRFTADIFEETQPRPQPNRTATGVGHALATPQFRWIAVLSGLASFYLFLGTVAAVLLARDILAGEAISTTATFALSQLAVGMFCGEAAHMLWGRFDFVSELIWVDLNGSFESAHVKLGNQISGNIQTTKNVINIEEMTMRVWVSEIDTVIFGKDDWRQLIGMRGLQDTADELATALKAFGETRSMVVAPTSAADLERAQQIGALHQLAGGAATREGETAHIANLLTSKLGAATMEDKAESKTDDSGSSGSSGTPKSLFCTGCGGGLDANMRFCSACGKAVAQ